MYRRRINEARICVYAETGQGVQLVINKIRIVFPDASNSPINQTQQGDFHTIINVSLQERDNE